MGDHAISWRLPAPSAARVDVLPRLASFLEAEVCRSHSAWRWFYVRAPKSGPWTLAAVSSQELRGSRASLRRLMVRCRLQLPGRSKPERLFSDAELRAYEITALDGLSLFELGWTSAEDEAEAAEDEAEAVEFPSGFPKPPAGEGTRQRRAELLARSCPSDERRYRPGRLAQLSAKVSELSAAGLFPSVASGAER